MKRGFTLIELLVVVLIIGILSSVALPQYTKAVEKSRMAGVWTNLSAMEKACQVASLATGNPWCNFDELDITFQECSGGSYCPVKCPSGSWTNCAYSLFSGDGDGVPYAFFSFTKGGSYHLISVKQGKRRCTGEYCSWFVSSDEIGS